MESVSSSRVRSGRNEHGEQNDEIGWKFTLIKVVFIPLPPFPLLEVHSKSSKSQANLGVFRPIYVNIDLHVIGFLFFLGVPVKKNHHVSCLRNKLLPNNKLLNNLPMMGKLPPPLLPLLLVQSRKLIFLVQDVTNKPFKESSCDISILVMR